MNRDVKALADALERLQAKHGTCQLDLSFGLVLIVIAQLQLALRHPGNRGASADQARDFVVALIGRLEASEPVVGPLLRRGFDPGFDVPITQPPESVL